MKPFSYLCIGLWLVVTSLAAQESNSSPWEGTCQSPSKPQTVSQENVQSTQLKSQSQDQFLPPDKVPKTMHPKKHNCGCGY